MAAIGIGYRMVSIRQHAAILCIPKMMPVTLRRCILRRRLQSRLAGAIDKQQSDRCTSLMPRFFSLISASRIRRRRGRAAMILYDVFDIIMAFQIRPSAFRLAAGENI